MRESFTASKHPLTQFQHYYSHRCLLTTHLDDDFERNEFRYVLTPHLYYISRRLSNRFTNTGCLIPSPFGGLLQARITRSGRRLHAGDTRQRCSLEDRYNSIHTVSLLSIFRHDFGRNSDAWLHTGDCSLRVRKALHQEG